MRRMWVMVAALSAATAWGADQSGYTLEQVMSAPFASGLTAAPKGGRIAWVFNNSGVRNIWTAEAPEYKGRQITSYAADEGMDLTALTWTPDGAAIVYVRGSAAREGNYPNPLSRTEGAEQAVWIVPASGGAPRRLDEGATPAVSPKGDRVAYVKKGQVWTAEVAGEPKPAQLFKARGECGSLRWSPDGGSLAFMNARGDHSFIGVYETGAGGALRYVDASVDRDSDPAWSPDGKRIAFLRIPNTRELALFGPKRSAEPWSVRVAEVASGRGREVWRARTGTGSVFRGIVADNQVFWAAGDRIVFPWEGDGWTHLYSVAAAGGEAARLTPGDFEVEHASRSGDGTTVVYSSNQGDIDRRHIWRVPAAGGEAARLTAGEGIEWSPVVTGDGSAVAFLGASAREPGRPFALAGGKRMDVAPDALPSGFPRDSMVTPLVVTFKAADGMEIRGQLFAAAGRPAERRPAVVFLHGGSRRQMLAGWHGMEYYHNTYAFNQYLANRGYVVLSVNYRSGTGYGMEFREALRYGAVGASEFNDVIGAGRYLRSRADVDPRRIGIWGGSYGGFLTALGLARESEMFAAGVDLHGVHDWRGETRVFLASDDLAVQQEVLKLAFESSPMAHVKTWKSPVLLIHGDDDPSVAFGQTVQLAEALRKQGVEFEQLVFPDEVHDFLTHARWLEALRAAAEFLDKHLR